LVRYTWVRNTIYDCGSFWNGGGPGGGYGLLSDGPASAGASNTLTKNLLTSLDVDTSGQFGASDHNLIKAGSRPGATDQAFSPQFSDTVDYRPTNLPAGYDDVGYRSAPAGYQAAGGSTPTDTTPPTTTIGSGPSGSTTSTSASFAFSSSETGSTFECKLDSGSFASCTSPKAYSGLSTGSHTFSVRATDAAGNTDASPAMQTWTITAPSDTTPPNTTIDSGPNASTTSTSASFAFSSSESGSTFACQLDSGSWASCTSPKAYSALGTGSHTFNVRATDAAGNVDASPASQTWTIDPPADNTPPDTSISAGPSGSTTSTSASFTFAASESGSVFECKLDAGAWASCTSPKAYNGLSTGSHTFSVRATDVAGNTDASPATRTWTIDAPADNTPPDTSITAGPSGSTASTSASFTLAASESGSVFECKLDAGAWASCTSPKAYNGLSTGSHTFSARATDLAGNTDASPATRTWTITAPPDTTAPDTSITAGPSGATNDATPTFTLASSETGSTFACRVDSGAWGSCTSPWTAPVLADGNHTVGVRATDAAGNRDATPASRSIAVDTAAPETTITSSPPGLSLSGSGSVSFSVNESGATSECRLDGGPWAACTSPYQVSGLGIGSHAVDVRSKDAAGNAESPGATASWTVLAPVTDAAPSVTLLSPGARETVGRSIRFAADATSSRGITRVEFWVDDDRVARDTRAPYTSREELGWLRSGMHTVTARAFDRAGRTASSATLVRVVSRYGGGARAAIVGSSATPKALLATAADGPYGTRLVGEAPSQRLLRVALTRCDDRLGTVVDRVGLLSDGQGLTSATRARAGLCVLRLALG
jgi:hypothetical protein